MKIHCHTRLASAPNQRLGARTRSMLRVLQRKMGKETGYFPEPCAGALRACLRV
jgi:hypothetical protein